MNFYYLNLHNMSVAASEVKSGLHCFCLPPLLLKQIVLELVGPSKIQAGIN